MEGQNILYGNIDDLREVYGAVEKQNELRNKISQAHMKKEELVKDIEAEEKHLRDVIDSTVKKRRADFTANFDKEMNKAQDRLKKVKNDRSKAKNKGVEARIKAETNTLIQDNKNLKNEIRTIFKQKGVLKFLDNKLVYIFYYPKTAREKFIFLISIIMMLLVIPSVVVKFINIFWLLEMIIYILVAGAFVGMYALGYYFAKVKYKVAFEETKIQRSNILKNEAKIRRIIKSIKKDKDDEQYELGEYDADIKELEEHISDIVKKKNEAVADFEKTTKQDIEDEIKNRDIGKIEKLKSELSEITANLKVFEDNQKNVTLSITTNYTAYMGEGNMSLDKLEKMMAMLSDGRANTIGDAINILKKEQNN